MNLRPKKMLRVPAAADMAGVSPWTIWRWLGQGRLKSYKLGGARRIAEEDLLELIEQAACEPDPRMPGLVPVRKPAAR